MKEVGKVDIEKFKHEFRVVLIKAYRKQLSRDEATAQAEEMFVRFTSDVIDAKKRIHDVMPDLCDGSIVVNEAQEEILQGD